MQCLQMYFILYTRFKNIRYVIRDIKTVPRPQEFYRGGTAPDGSEIPGSTTVRIPSCYTFPFTQIPKNAE